MENVKERPILMNTESVGGILGNRKTQTRRVIKPQPIHPIWTGARWVESGNDDTVHYEIKCPYGKIGDRFMPAMEIPSLNRNYCADVYGNIWSRAADGKTYKKLKGASQGKGYLTVTPAIDGKYKTRLIHRLVAEAFYGYEPNGYKQTRHLDGDNTNNNPSNLDWGTQKNNWADRRLHNGERDYTDPPNLPRWVSRINLEITDIRVEKVRDISRDDCIEEGVPQTYGGFKGLAPEWASKDKNDASYFYDNRTSRENFYLLWNSINAKRGYGWEVNPWVWIVTFKVLKKEV